MPRFSATQVCPRHAPRLWCKYNTLKLTMDLISLVMVSVVGISLQLKRSRLNAADPRRTRTLADFTDILVITICVIDVICAVPELFYVFDTSAYPFLFFKPQEERAPDTIIFVQINAALILLNVMWHTYIAYNIYAFIVLKYSVSRLKRTMSPTRMFIGGMFVLVAYVLIFFLLWLLFDRRGDFRVIAVVAAVGDLFFAPFVLAMVGMYISTTRALAGQSTDVAFLTGRYSRIRMKLMVISIAIPTLMTLGFVCDGIVWINLGMGRRPPMASLFIRVIAFRSTGLVDALIFGGALDLCLSEASEGRGESEVVAMAMLAHHPASDEVPSSSAGAEGMDDGAMPHRIKIFVTTCNVGGCTDVKALGPLDRWIPSEGYDLYVIGLQECLILQELREAILEYLGGKEAYHEFGTEIGDTTILNGMIALTVLVRASDYASGAVAVYHAAHGKVYTGMKLGPMGHAPNKGMVGLSVRYHEVSIACITAHFAADKHGKNRLDKRNRDACRALRDLSLLYDVNEFDCHLQHDYAILLGDLNYRVSLQPEEALVHIQRSAVMEQQKWSTLRRLARRTQLQPQPQPVGSSTSCADGGSSSSCLQSVTTDGASGLFSPVCDGSSWRQERYNESFFNLQEPSPTTMMDPASSAMRPASGLLNSQQQQQAVSSLTDVDSPVPLALHEPTSTSRSSGSNLPPPSSSYDTIRRSWTASNFMASMADRMQGSMRWRANGGYEHPADMMEQGLGVEMTRGGEPATGGSDEQQQHGGGGGGEARRSMGFWLRRSPSVECNGPVVTSEHGSVGSAHDCRGAASHPWRWVRQHDELSSSMASSLILSGFREKCIRFPPSYRWVRGAHGSDLSDLSVLHDCYSLRAHSAQSGTTSRTPSYTDRILLHAMPDRAGRAYIRAYDSCADITGSDHRPVTARIDVLVDRTVHGFNHRALTTNNSQSTVSEDTDNSELAAPTATARTSSTITSANVSDLEPGKAPESSREGSNTSAVGGALQPVQQSQHSARVQRILAHLQGGGPSQPPHLAKSASQMENGPIEPYEGPLAIWRVELRDLSFNCMGSTQVDCPEIDEVLCLFPLPVEDPLARDRKTVALGESFAPRLTSKKSNAGGASSNLSESIQSVHRIAYHVIESEGCFAVSSIVAPRFCRHMLIKFLDAQGVDLGQGIICLKDVRECDPSDSVEVPLSSGGEEQMSVRLTVSLQQMPYSPSHRGSLASKSRGYSF